MKTWLERTISFGCCGDRLVGIFHDAAHRATTGIVILVGGPQYRVGSHRMFVRIARALAAAGFPTLRFDFRGMGDSEGIFPGFEDLDEDTCSAIDALCQLQPDLEQIVLLGLCDGATAGAMYAHKDDRVRGLILLNPWIHTPTGQAKAYLWHYYPQRVLQRKFWQSLFAGKVNLAGSLQDFGSKMARTLRSRLSASSQTSPYVTRMRTGLAGFTGPIVIIASENDLTASEFMDTLNSQKPWIGIKRRATTRLIKNADHTLSGDNQIHKFCSIAIAWLQAQFGPAAS